MDGSTDDSGSPTTDTVETEIPTTTPSPDDFTQSTLPVETVIHYLYNNGLHILSGYGWYILLFVIVTAIAWSRIKPHFYQWSKKREEWLDEQNFDPVKAERYQDAMLKAREKMQTELNEKAITQQDNQEKRQTEERDERIKQWEEFRVVSTSKKKKPRDDDGRKEPAPRRDYFPLGGGGGGGGYRPPRRMVGRGGG